MTYTRQPLIDTYHVSSIEPWRAHADGTSYWEWNNIYSIGFVDLNISKGELNPRKLFKILRDLDILTDDSKGRIRLYDDGTSLAVHDRITAKPLIAITLIEDDTQHISDNKYIRQL